MPSAKHSDYSTPLRGGRPWLITASSCDWLQAPELNRIFRGYEPRGLPFALPALNYAAPGVPVFEFSAKRRVDCGLPFGALYKLPAAFVAPLGISEVIGPHFFLLAGDFFVSPVRGAFL